MWNYSDFLWNQVNTFSSLNRKSTDVFVLSIHIYPYFGTAIYSALEIQLFLYIRYVNKKVPVELHASVIGTPS